MLTVACLEITSRVLVVSFEFSNLEISVWSASPLDSECMAEAMLLTLCSLSGKLNFTFLTCSSVSSFSESLSSPYCFKIFFLMSSSTGSASKLTSSLLTIVSLLLTTDSICFGDSIQK
eukprot:NODE_248_length_12985_cov_0.286357.p9 type:complete len:118 gc:universal NODE_248_length_12985_cov_0.286357:5389-5742(+)